MNELHAVFGDVYSFPVAMSAYDCGTKFYRVRAIPPDDTKLPMRTISAIADAWEPPAELVSVPGRLNDIGQSILYCCPNDAGLAIQEARATDSKHVAVMVYRARKSVNVAVIGGYTASSLPQDEQTKMFYSFLEEEFSRFAQSGHEQEYIVTRTVADSFFSYPEQDGWCYRSVQSSQKFNVAFLPGKSKENLELVGVLLCDNSKAQEGQLSVLFVVDFENDTGVARYHRIGSEGQKNVFPEIG